MKRDAGGDSPMPKTRKVGFVSLGTSQLPGCHCRPQLRLGMTYGRLREGALPQVPWVRADTRLILPANVCFPQGLSHARVRASCRAAQLFCEWLIIPALISAGCGRNPGSGKLSRELSLAGWFAVLLPGLLAKASYRPRGADGSTCSVG